MGALALLQFVYMPALRFATPMLPFVAIAAAVGGARLARSGRGRPGLLTIGLAGIALQQAVGLGRALPAAYRRLRDPHAYERREYPDQAALREAVARAEPVVAIPKGAVAWMPKPVYVLHWERNGELFFDRVARLPDAARCGARAAGAARRALARARRRAAAAGRWHDRPHRSSMPGSAPAGPACATSPTSLRADGRVWVTIDLLDRAAADASR